MYPYACNHHPSHSRKFLHGPEESVPHPEPPPICRLAPWIRRVFSGVSCEWALAVRGCPRLHLLSIVRLAWRAWSLVLLSCWGALRAGHVGWLLETCSGHCQGRSDLSPGARSPRVPERTGGRGCGTWPWIPTTPFSQTHSVPVCFTLWTPYIISFAKQVFLPLMRCLKVTGLYQPAPTYTPLVAGRSPSARKFFLESCFSSFLGSPWSSGANRPTWSSRDPRPEGNTCDKENADPAEAACSSAHGTPWLPLVPRPSCLPRATTSLWPVIPPSAPRHHPHDSCRHSSRPGLCQSSLAA